MTVQRRRARDPEETLLIAVKKALRRFDALEAKTVKKGVGPVETVLLKHVRRVRTHITRLQKRIEKLKGDA